MSSTGEGPVLAAGTVVRRTGDEGPEVLLVHRPKYDDWSFPKGKAEPGEHALTTALRETAEETGLAVRLERPLPEQGYTVSGRPKVVRYWLATQLDGRFRPNSEVDEVAWLPLAAARDRLSWQRDAALLDDLAALPGETTALLLVRHAEAVPRDAWDGDDAMRPLTPAGRAQAAALVELLDAYAPTRVVSSDAVRALETVAPLAEDAGLVVEVDPLLSEEGWSAGPGAELLPAALVGDRRTVACSHQQVLPRLLEALCAASPVRPPQAVPPVGGVVALHLHEGRPVAVEEHAPGGC
ncbi:8-oxo-dGTP diphosphatase [Motilibacter rhizosphaerae]|uniref:8-oxo-dGTP diphosphatase n=1 Tax=Motilibacter rhizosphaerae TaxID=598652 RepID=A0A4Q7NUN5_9ACTN|nr:NUDIX hydrolase [Motilibacter rhizosphaerae]RZS90794.1 8-oxo-dGTP diphosphatase [Motilibacter rhizosphaerae]